MGAFEKNWQLGVCVADSLGPGARGPGAGARGPGAQLGAAGALRMAAIHVPTASVTAAHLTTTLKCSNKLFSITTKTVHCDSELLAPNIVIQLKKTETDLRTPATPKKSQDSEHYVVYIGLRMLRQTGSSSS